MSDIVARVETLKVLPHENADALEIVEIEGYRAVVAKGLWKTGDLGAYIPEGAVLPQLLVDRLKLTGKLAGPEANRVKACKLRGVLSQGLVCPQYIVTHGADEFAASSQELASANLGTKPTRPRFEGDEYGDDWQLGDDVTAELGITKWEAPIPAALAGRTRRVRNPLDIGGRSAQPATIRYDIENAKAYASDRKALFVLGEHVVMCEKIHGTQVQYGLTACAADGTREFFISSKGLAAKGIDLDPDAPENATNLYVRTAKYHDIEGRLRGVFAAESGANPAPIVLFGEIFGAGVQDLHYGYNAKAPETTGVRFYDIYVGTAEHGRFLSDTLNDPFAHTETHELDDALAALQLPRVPVIYRGPYSPEKLAELTDGPETVSGKSLHMREGVVIRPIAERHDDRLGIGIAARVQLKSVSGAYLTRKGGTEYN